MQYFGTQLRRKSIEKVQPTLPAKNSSEKYLGERTKHNDLQSPKEQLAEFKRRQIGKYQTLASTQRYETITKNSKKDNDQSYLQQIINQKDIKKYTYQKTFKSHSKNNTETHSKSILTSANTQTPVLSNKTKTQPDRYNLQLGQSRFQDDHHNTESLAELIQNTDEDFTSKGLVTQRKQIIQQKDSIGISISSQVVENGEIKQQGSEYDGYLLGDKASDAEEQQQQQIDLYKIKKYQNDHKNTDRTSTQQSKGKYQPITQCQHRMEQRYWQIQQKMIVQKNQDKQMIAILHQFQRNRKQIKANSMRKAQINRALKQTKIIGKISNKPISVQRTLSLPSLKPKREIIVPIQDSIIQKQQKQKSQKNPFLKNPQKQRIFELKIRGSLSFAKLGLKRKKIFCETDFMETELKDVEIIQKKLRENGIPFNPKSIRNGIINLRTVADYSINEKIPEKQLLSNPQYKKFPL